MKKYKNIIFIILAVIIIGVLIYFVYIPQIKDSLLIWTKNAIKQDQVSSLEKEKSDLNSLKQQEKDVENMINALAALVPEKKDAGSFIIETEALAAATGVNVSDIKFSQAAKTPTQQSTSADTSTGKTSTVKGVSDSSLKFKELVYEMTAKGEYSQVINFLKGLEKMKRATTIEKADLSEIQGLIQANFKGKIYYKND
jgi:Tfp pilus assembly protein PilO